MQKTERARATKKLQAELKDEKQSEIQRRRQITKERKQAAAERQRIEEEKAKVDDHSGPRHPLLTKSYRWAHEELRDFVVGWVVRRKSIIEGPHLPYIM
jgi:hypothetical protein